MHGSISCRRHDPRYPAVRTQRNVRGRLGPTSQHELDQRPGRTEERQAEIPPRQYANIGPLVLDLLCDIYGYGPSFLKITLEARENITERLQATREQPMWVPILGGAGP